MAMTETDWSVKIEQAKERINLNETHLDQIQEASELRKNDTFETRFVVSQLVEI